MKLKSTKIVKVPNGKLLRVDVEFDKKNILNVKITGDFFLHPENTIELFEKKIKQIPTKFDCDKLIRTLNKIAVDNKAQLIGITTRDIIKTLEEAINAKS